MARARLIMGLGVRLLGIGFFVFGAVITTYAGVFLEHWVIVLAVLFWCFVIAMAALLGSEAWLMVLDLGAKPMTKETSVSSKREEAWSNQYGSGVNYYMQFASLGGEFQVSKREFEHFYMCESVLVSYYPRSKTIARICYGPASR